MEFVFRHVKFAMIISSQVEGSGEFKEEVEMRCSFGCCVVVVQLLSLV